MADERLGIEIAARATGFEQVDARVAALKATIANLSDALGSGMARGSASFTAALQSQIATAEAEIKRLTSTTIQQYSALEGFNIRAIAAMRGQADAIRGVAREMTELDRITRAGSSRVAYGVVDPVALRQAEQMSAAARKIRQAELEGAFAGQSGGSPEQVARARISTMLAEREEAAAAKAASATRGIGGALTGAAAGSAVASREVGHLNALFDELASGRHRQAISTIGASLRDAGLGTTGLVVGLGAITAAAIVGGFERMVASAGQMAEKTLNAAEAAGVAVDKYTQLRTVLAIQSGDAESLPRALGLLQQHAETALTNPFSGAAAGFASLGVGPDQLKEGLRDPIALLERLREEYQKLGPAAAEAMRLAFGRAGFQELAGYLRMTTEQLKENTAAARATGEVYDEGFAKSLAEAGVKTNELGQAFAGLRDHMAALAGSSGLTDWLTRQVEELGHAADGWRMFFDSISKARSVQTPVFTGGEDMGMGMSAGITSRISATATAGAGGTDLIHKVSTASANIDQVNAEFGRRLEMWLESLSAADQAAIKITAGFATSGHAPDSDHYRGTAADIHGMSPAAVAKLSQFGLAQNVAGDYPHIEPAEIPSAQAASVAQRVAASKAFVAQFPGQLGAAGTVASTSLPPQIPTAGDIYQPEAARAELDRQTKQIEDRRKIRDSQYDIEIANLEKDGKDQQAVANLKAERAAKDIADDQAIQKLHDDAANRAKAAGAQPAVEQTFREGATSAAVQANTTQAAAINAQTAANQQAYQQQRENQMNAVEDAKTAADQILNSAKSTTEQKIAALKQEEGATTSHYATIIAMAKQYGQQSVEVTRQERAEKAAVLEIENKIAQVRRQGVTDAMSSAGSSGEILQSQRATLQAQIETEATLARTGQGRRGGGLFGGGGEGALVAEYQKDAQLVQSIADQQAAAWQKIASDSNASSEQVEKAEAKIAEIRAKAAQEQAQDFEKAYQAYQKAHEGLMNFISSLGSGFQTMTNSLIKALISPQVDIIHAGLTTIRTTERGQEIRQAIGQMLLHGVQSAVDSVEASVGNVLKNWLSQAFSSMGAPAVGNFLTGGASSAASAATTTTPIVTAISAQTASLTASQTASTTAIVTAIQTSAAVQAAVPKPFGFAGGGIVPSAAGGMVVGGVGGTLAVLHPQEMVLPANISQGVQRMVAGGSGSNSNSTSHSVTYAPQINTGSGPMSRPEFSQMLAGHKDDIVGMMRQEMRGGWRP